MTKDSLARSVELPFHDPRVSVETRPDNSVLIWSIMDALRPESSIAHLFAARAAEIPERTLVAERKGDGGWRTATYGDLLERALRVAAAFLSRGMKPGERVLVLSGPGIDHAAVSLGAMLAKLVIVPVSTAYSLGSDRSRLAHAIELTRPTIAFADDAEGFAAALGDASAAGIAILSASDGALERFENSALPVDLAAALSEIRPETVYKFLLTSGSTALPKATIQTHAMSCASLAFEASLSNLPVGVREPQVVLDWMPWSHVGGGITIFNNILFSGSSLYLDDGRPVAGQFDATVRNLDEFPQEVFASPPIGFAMLNDAMDRNSGFRDRFFSRLLYVKSGGAAMPAEVRRRFQSHAIAATGREMPVLMGYGTTETHGVLSVNRPTDFSSILGLPKPGVQVKLVPDGDAYELRIKAASVTPGYFQDPAATEAAFDEEGFFRTGDAVAPPPGGFSEGLLFTGRIGDNFKTASGSWVAGAELRATILDVLDGEATDCIVVGEGQLSVCAIVWADENEVRRERICDLLRTYNDDAKGETRRIARILFSRLPISTAAFERTEKGSINRALVLANRPEELRALYDNTAQTGAGTDVVDLSRPVSV